MSVTTFEAVVEHGQIKLPPHVQLPEKAIVYVVAPGVDVRPLASIASPRLLHPEQARDFRMEVLRESRDDAV